MRSLFLAAAALSSLVAAQALGAAESISISVSKDGQKAEIEIKGTVVHTVVLAGRSGMQVMPFPNLSPDFGLTASVSKIEEVHIKGVVIAVRECTLDGHVLKGLAREKYVLKQGDPPPKDTKVLRGEIRWSAKEGLLFTDEKKRLWYIMDPRFEENPQPQP